MGGLSARTASRCDWTAVAVYDPTMDPLTGTVIITGLTTVGKPTAEALTTVVGKILGPSVDAIGQGKERYAKPRDGPNVSYRLAAPTDPGLPLILQKRGPVHDDRERERRGSGSQLADEEALAVGHRRIAACAEWHR